MGRIAEFTEEIIEPSKSADDLSIRLEQYPNTRTNTLVNEFYPTPIRMLAEKYL
jgi:hypothetical protein